jgi:hypothetical protein
MKKLLPLLFLISFKAFSQQSETTDSALMKLPIIVSANFQTIATPFHNLKNNFRNLGIKIGTEISYNKKRNILQSFNIGYYRNRLNGDGLYINSEFIYRPKIYKPIRMEIKLGPGLADVFLPTQPYEPDGNGNWRKATNYGKLALQVHGSIGIWYQSIAINKIRISPFLQYEIVGIIGYNKSIPVLPTTMINIGCRINFKRIKYKT